MSNLYLTRGFPGAGKTTYAKAWLALDPDNRVRVNRDDLRMMTFNKKVGLTFPEEEYISKLSQNLVREALKNGKDVIVDDMNVRPKYVKDWYKLALEFAGTEVFVAEILADSLDALIERNRTRPEGDQVHEEAIRGMFERYTKKGAFLPVETFPEFKEAQTKSGVEFTPYKHSGLPTIILVDIDGTVAMNTGGRGWYDYTRVHEDTNNEDVVEVVRALSEQYPIVFMSGRDDSCYDTTVKWLREVAGFWWVNENSIGNEGVHTNLVMRKTGDMRSDDVVKSELFDSHILGKFDVLAVIDDRPQVNRMWRAKGLTTLQVGDPHIEF